MSTALAAQIEPYAALFARVEPAMPAAARDARHAAFARFLALGFPTARLEEWKKTDVSALAATSFSLPPAGSPASDAEAAATVERVLGPHGGARVVIVNGRFAPHLSTATATARSLAGVLADGDPARAVALEDLDDAATQGGALAALHAAFAEDGVLVDVPERTDGVVLTIVHVTSAGADPTLVFPWTIVRVGALSSAVIVEAHIGSAASPYWTNGASTVLVGEGSRVDHVILQDDAETASHTLRVRARQARNSRYASHVVGVGARLSRTSVDVTLAEAGGDTELAGLYAPHGTQHMDYHTTIDHVAPHCTSREIYHGILDEQAHAVFNGRIIVRPDAQKTDARQTNRNLLLSDTALIDTQPQLEIFANDVKCAHGATVGQINEDALFYLRARGLDRATARALLTAAFASGIVDRVPAAGRDAVRRVLAGRVRGIDAVGTGR